MSNGIAEPSGDNFALDQQIYEMQHDVKSGLGPVFNARACAECHQNPVSGGASQSPSFGPDISTPTATW